MSAAPHDRIIEVVGRLPWATAGFPQYSMWNGAHGFFSSVGYNAPHHQLVCWAWRERTDWPCEPSDKVTKKETSLGKTARLDFVEWYEKNVFHKYPGVPGELFDEIFKRIFNSLPDYIEFVLKEKNI